MQFKKLTTLFMASLVLVGILTGCGTSGNDPKETETEQNEPEVSSAASISEKAEDLVGSMAANGHWIFAAEADITLTEELVIEGVFHDKGNTDNDLRRKVALYTQDSDRNVEEEFTLTAPGITVKSPAVVIQNGTVVSDIYVEGEGFNLVDSTIEGNITFASQELYDAFMENGMNEGASVTGEITVSGEEAAVTSAASISDNGEDLVGSMAANGHWIFAAVADITLTEELVIEGVFHDKDNAENDLRRKVALYTQDSDRNVEEEFTLTIPGITVKSPAVVIQNGTVVSDIHVEGEGFNLVDSTIEGNITFASQELYDAFMENGMNEGATVNGEITVAE